MDRVFLDANVLFSAAYRSDSRLRELWSLTGVTLISSDYAIEEARRNLAIHRPERIDHLDQLIACLTIVSTPAVSPFSNQDVSLAEKDAPILAAAISSDATHLLTGDKAHFGELLGKTIRGVLILSPAAYLSG